jgi:hypothetical protein
MITQPCSDSRLEWRRLKYAAILNGAGADLRAQAQREQLAFLSNVCSAKLGLSFAPADSAFLGEGIELWAGSVGASTVGQLAGPATSSPCFCADSMQIALVNQPIDDPFIQAQYNRLLADLTAVDGGVGIGPTCATIAYSAPVLLEHLESFNQVIVEWDLRAATGLPVAMYRRGSADWTRVQLFPPDGSVIGYFDFTAMPSTAYSYRIGVNPDGREQFYGEVSIRTPSAPPFALVGAIPNPTFDALRVALTLPNRSPLTVEVFDLSGRKVASHRDDNPPFGPWVVNLGSSLRAGIYVVRVHQAGLSSSTKAVVLR